MNKMIVGLCLFSACLLAACARKPHVTHKVKLDNSDTSCAALQDYFRMNSNFGGERYEFEKCLPSDFTDKQVSSERRGDTVLVKFTSNPGKANALYKITLDIDSYPLYRFLTIDGDTYTIAAADK